MAVTCLAVSGNASPWPVPGIATRVLVECGSHAELSAEAGRYAAMYWLRARAYHEPDPAVAWTSP